MRKILFFCGLLVLLEILVVVSGASPAAFARPSEVLVSCIKFVCESGTRDTAATLVRTLVAIALSIPTGILIGLAISKSRFQSEATLVVDFARSIPATALVPLFLVIFGLGSASKIAAGVMSGALSISVSVIAGFRRLDPTRAFVSRNVGLRGFRLFLLSELPEIMPSLVVGVRTAVSLCLILVVVAEMFIGSTSGLGSVIIAKRYTDDTPGFYAAIVCTGLLGFFLNWLLSRIEASTLAYFGTSPTAT